MTTELKRRFKLYHEKNPHVYEMFKRFAFAAVQEKDQYSADAVLHRMRWYTEIETRGDRFKINNNYAAYYGRLFMADFPQHAGFFRTRVLGEARGLSDRGRRVQAKREFSAMRENMSDYRS